MLIIVVVVDSKNDEPKEEQRYFSDSNNSLLDSIEPMKLDVVSFLVELKMELSYEQEQNDEQVQLVEVLKFLFVKRQRRRLRTVETKLMEVVNDSFQILLIDS